MFLPDSICDGAPVGAARTERRGGAGLVPMTDPAPAALARTDFARQIEAELPFLQRAVRRWHRDRASADDLVQDTLLQALANAHLWQPGSNLRAWLVTIMRNRFLAGAAQAKRSARMADQLTAPDAAPVHDESDARLVLRDVERALRRLSEKQRALILATALHDKSYEQVAQETGTSAAAVRCNLARGRERLRAIVFAAGHRSPLAVSQRAPGAAARTLILPIAVLLASLLGLPLTG